jgi:hypothetical protein
MTGIRRLYIARNQVSLVEASSLTGLRRASSLTGIMSDGF